MSTHDARGNDMTVLKVSLNELPIGFKRTETLRLKGALSFE